MDSSPPAVLHTTLEAWKTRVQRPQFSSGNRGCIARPRTVICRCLRWRMPGGEDGECDSRIRPPRSLDSLLQDKYSEAIHNLAKMWPDEGSLEVSFREVEGYDHEFAQDILANPDHHFRAANQALRQFLLDAGEGNLMPFVRIIHLPSDQVRTVSQLRADDIGRMIAIDAVRPRSPVFARGCTRPCSNAWHAATPWK